MASDKVTRRGLSVHVPPAIENHTLRTRAEALAAGDTRYFTGNPCPHGHIAERRVSNWKCVQCARDEFSEMIRKDPQRGRDRSSTYQKRHAERCRIRKQRWVEENREHVFEQKRAYRAANADHIQHRKRQDYLKNRERVLEQTAEWQRRNPEKVKQRNARWRAANPDAAKAITQRRRAKRAAAEGSYTAADVAALFEKQDGACVGCRISLSCGYDVDHIVPLSRGGSNWATNIQLLCGSCNGSKGARTMNEWREYLKRRGYPDGRDSSLPDNGSRLYPA